MTTLLSQAGQASTGLNVKGFVIVAIVFALVYPLQKQLRAWVSRRRVERWREEDARGEQPKRDSDLDRTGRDGPDGPDAHDGPDDARL